ncbi:MAG TPA: hypothetical protein VD913_05545 [bacterium]|nr:hypothetical protein [bacterium]
MEKPRWLEFLSSRLKSQISLENAEKAQTWAFAFLALVALGFALNAAQSAHDSLLRYPATVLFLLLFHPILILTFYLPNFLDRENKPAARLLKIRDFTSLTASALILAFFAVVITVVSFQAAAGAGEVSESVLLGLAAWGNFIFSLFYLSACFFYFSGFLWFPQALAKIMERTAKTAPFLVAVHGIFLILLGFVYAGFVPFGSATFLEQFKSAGLFWVFIVSSVLFIGRLLSESSIPSLASLELDMASGRLERSEEILNRLKEAFVSGRLSRWTFRLSQSAMMKANEIAQLTDDALSVVGREKPTEIDLRLVEDRYRRADNISKKLEKENQRFLLSVSFFDSSDAEHEKIEELRDLFSKTIRNAKLELASVRKGIDERLVTLKNSQPLPQISVQKKALPERVQDEPVVGAAK